MAQVIEGQVALITGGAGGIGAAITIELLNNGLKGIAIVDISEDLATELLKKIQEKFGPGKAIFIKTDITDKQQFEDAFEEATRHFKQLDIVINNAGIMDAVNWEKVIATNLTATIRGSLLAMDKYLPRFRSGAEGVLVNIASVIALQTHHEVAPVYTASKRGVISFSQTISGPVHYRNTKVRVLTICPGGVNTPILKQFAFLAEEVLQSLEHGVIQEPKFVGEAVLKALNEGQSGSVWVTEKCQDAYEVKMLDSSI